MQGARRQSEKDYYKDYMRLLFEQGETYENYKQVIQEYESALAVKEELIKKLEKEIAIIKTLKT